MLRVGEGEHFGGVEVVDHVDAVASADDFGTIVGAGWNIGSGGWEDQVASFEFADAAVVEAGMRFGSSAHQSTIPSPSHESQGWLSVPGVVPVPPQDGQALMLLPPYR